MINFFKPRKSRPLADFLKTEIEYAPVRQEPGIVNKKFHFEEALIPLEMDNVGSYNKNKDERQS